MLTTVLLLSLLAGLGPALTMAAPGSYPPTPNRRCKAANSGLSSYEAFARYADQLYNKRDVAGAIRTYFDPDFIWHESGHAASGRRGLDDAIRELEDLDFRGGDIKFQYVQPPCAQGQSIGSFYYRFQSKVVATPLAASDAYRFEGPCVAEYWLLYQEISGNSTESDFFNKKLADKLVVPNCVGKG